MRDFKTLISTGADYSQFASQGNEEQIQHLQREQAKTEQADFIRGPLMDEIQSLTGHYTLLVAAEMWCPDCLRNVPALQALCQTADMPMKIVTREQAAPLFESCFKVEKVKIPFVAILDAELKPIGTFIERPLNVQNGGEDALLAYKRGERLVDTVEEVVTLLRQHECSQ